MSTKRDLSSHCNKTVPKKGGQALAATGYCSFPVVWVDHLRRGWCRRHEPDAETKARWAGVAAAMKGEVLERSRRGHDESDPDEAHLYRTYQAEGRAEQAEEAGALRRMHARARRQGQAPIGDPAQLRLGEKLLYWHHQVEPGPDFGEWVPEGLRTFRGLHRGILGEVTLHTAEDFLSEPVSQFTVPVGHPAAAAPVRGMRPPARAVAEKRAFAALRGDHVLLGVYGLSRDSKTALQGVDREATVRTAQRQHIGWTRTNEGPYAVREAGGSRYEIKSYAPADRLGEILGHARDEWQKRGYQLVEAPGEVLERSAVAGKACGCAHRAAQGRGEVLERSRAAAPWWEGLPLYRVTVRDVGRSAEVRDELRAHDSKIHDQVGPDLYASVMLDEIAEDAQRLPNVLRVAPVKALPRRERPRRQDDGQGGGAYDYTSWLPPDFLAAGYRLTVMEDNDGDVRAELTDRNGRRLLWVSDHGRYAEGAAGFPPGLDPDDVDAFENSDPLQVVRTIFERHEAAQPAGEVLEASRRTTPTTLRIQTGRRYAMHKARGDTDTCVVVGVASRGAEHRGEAADAIIAAERAAGINSLLIVRLDGIPGKEIDLAASELSHEVFRSYRLGWGPGDVLERCGDHAGPSKKPCCASCARGGPCTGHTEASARRAGQVGLHINREALRDVLGTETVLEADRVATARPSVNVGEIWRYFTTSVYRNGDLPVLACREALQNSVDAIRKAIRAHKLGKDEGRFSVEWNPDTRVLSFEDNGIGMDLDTIQHKFLSLGDSGKRDETGSDEAAGGFGVAKAVILGTSSTFTWELHTRGHLAKARGAAAEIDIFSAEARPGTKITLQDVDPKFDRRYESVRGAYVDLETRLRELLAANDLPIALFLNGQRVAPMFLRTHGRMISQSGNWGPGTTARVKAYRRIQNGGGYYIRLGGLLQFRRPASHGNLRADVVIDLQTSVRPGADNYPLTAARDSLQHGAERAFDELAEEVEKESESTGRAEEYEVYAPEEDGQDEVGKLVAEGLADREFQAALRQASTGLLDYLREQGKYRGKAEEPGSVAPSSSKGIRPGGLEEGEDLARPTMGGPPPGLVAAAEEPPAPAATPVEQIRVFLKGAETAAAGTAEQGEILTNYVTAVLNDMALGVDVPQDQARRVEQAIEKATEVAMGPRGGGVLQAAQGAVALQALQKAAPEAVRVKNPFGAFAGLRISKKNYDKARARRFKQNIGKWLPHLAVWHQALQMVASEGGIRLKFKPGYILDDTLNGLAAMEPTGEDERRRVIYVHPDRLAQVVKAHRERPLSIAAWLHNLACHELAHMDGLMGDGHGEQFSVKREALASSSAHVVEPLAAYVAAVLNLPVPPTPVEKERQRLARALEQCRSRVTEARKGRPKPASPASLRKMAEEDIAEIEAEVKRWPPSETRNQLLAALRFGREQLVRKYMAQVFGQAVAPKALPSAAPPPSEADAGWLEIAGRPPRALRDIDRELLASLGTPATFGDLGRAWARDRIDKLEEPDAEFLAATANEYLFLDEATPAEKAELLAGIEEEIARAAGTPRRRGRA